MLLSTASSPALKPLSATKSNATTTVAVSPLVGGDVVDRSGDGDGAGIGALVGVGLGTVGS